MNSRQYTDKELNRLEKSIVEQYTIAYKKLKKEMNNIMAQISVKENLSLSEKMSLINRYNRLDKLCNEMAEIIKNTNVLAVSLINQTKKNIYKENYNEIADKFNLPILSNIEVTEQLKNIKNPFIDIAIQEEKDKTLIAGRFKSEILSGLLLGQGINAMAERLKNVTQKYVNKSIGIARGETTTIENGAINEVGNKLEKSKRNIWKRWKAVHDDKTRTQHAIADGKEVPFNKPFYVGGEYLMYPGDRSLGATDKNIINCRCRIELFEKK